MTVTRSDVARAAGISPSVVSYVINNGPRPVSAPVRARVEAAIKELGYRPNAIASALRGGTSRSIGLLTPGLRNPQHAEFAEALEQHFSAHDYLMLTGNTGNDRSQERRYLSTFVDRKVDGIIFAPGISLSGSAVSGVGEIPLFVVDDVASRPENSTIRTQDAEDATYGVEHLQGHGHTLIGCICGPSNVLAGTRPVDGWRAAQRANSAPAGDELVAHAETSEIGGYSAALLLLSAHGRPTNLHGTRPTALFVASDAQAIGAIYACYELGLRVPEDVAVVSLGGTRLATYFTPPITSMRRDVDYIAQTVVTHLLERIKNPQSEPIHSQLRGNLVIGRSCGC